LLLHSRGVLNTGYWFKKRDLGKKSPWPAHSWRPHERLHTDSVNRVCKQHQEPASYLACAFCLE